MSESAPSTGQRPPRKPRRSADENAESPFTRRAFQQSPLPVAAFTCAVIALIPPLGLVLGPFSVVIGLVARSRLTPEERNGAGRGRALIAILLGSVITLTSWTGAYLMFRALVQNSQ